MFTPWHCTVTARYAWGMLSMPSGLFARLEVHPVNLPNKNVMFSSSANFFVYCIKSVFYEEFLDNKT